MAEKKTRKIETTTLHVVPQSDRKGWLDISFIQAGVYICIPSLLLGGLLAQSMPFNQAIIAAIIGYFISAAITAVIGIIGSDMGVPTCIVAIPSFGKSGARIMISSFFAIALIGWFMVQNGVCGAAFSSMMQTIGFNIPKPASVVFWGAVMLITAVQGIDGLKWLNRVAVPALFVIMTVGSVFAVNKYGTAALSANTDQTMSILGGVILTASFLSVGMTVVPDFTRYQKSRGGVFASSYVGIMIPGVIMAVMGALMTRLAGQNDLTIILSDIGFPILGMIILILATWTTNTTNAYSAGIDLVMIFNLKDNKRAITTVIAGAIGTILAAMGYDRYFETFINWLGILFFPVAGVMLADYWICRKGDASKWAYSEGFNWSGIIAWLAGVLATLYIPVGWSLFLGFFISGAVYVVLRSILPKKEEIIGMVDFKGDLDEHEF